MKVVWQVIRALCRVPLGLPVLLTGCAGGSAYRALVGDFTTNTSTAYYRHEVSAGQVAGTPEAAKRTDAFLDEAEQKILSARQRWEKALVAESDPGSLQDFEPGNYAQYRQLAKDPALDRKLAAGVDLTTLVGLVHELNPAVTSAQRNLTATLEQYPQAAYLDNILKQYNAFTKQLDTKIGPQQHKSMMAMSFPFPDTLALKGEIVSEEVEIARRDQEIVLRDAMTQVRQAYYGYLFVNEAIAINRENQQLLEQMIVVAQAKLRVDKASYNAVIMAQVELSKLSDAIITLEEQRETLVARLNTLLSRQPNAALGTPRPVTDVDLGLSLDELYAVALEDRQELQQERLRIGRMKTMVDLATRMAYPDVSLGAGYFEDRMRLSGGAGDAPPAFMTGRELDHRQTPWFGQRDAYIREVATRVEAMNSMLTAMEDKTRFEVKEAHFGLQTAKRSIALYRQSLLPQARQSLEAANAGYRAGQTDFLTFLDAERTLLKFRLEEQRAIRDFRTQQAKLEQLAGRSLPRTTLDLKSRQQEEQNKP